MADNTDETGKKTARPGEAPAPKRPYATIDLRATEVAGEGQPSPTSEPKPAQPASGPAAAPESKPEAKPAMASAAGSGPAPQAGGEDRSKGGATSRADRPMRSLGGKPRSSLLMTHLGAGVVGGLFVVAATYLLAPTAAPPRLVAVPEVGELTRRVADLEGVLGTRPGAGGLRARVDEMSRSVTALGNTQAKLARESKELEDRIGSGRDAPSEITSRIAKLEQAMAAAPSRPADPASGQTSGPVQAPAALSNRLAELERAAHEANDAAKSAAARATADLAAVRNEAARLGQRLDGIRSEVDDRLQGAAKAADFAPLARKLTALEQELQAFAKTEAGRKADAGRIVLSLELAALRRAVDRGDSYTAEVAAVKSAAGDSLNLAPLERHMREGVSPVRELEKSFHPVANVMLDAEADRTDATLVDRLVSSARSIVRVRKLGHTADDTSAEAVIGRMDAALKEGRLAEVLEQAKKLPPKAALVSEEWVKRVEARHAVDRAMAEVETTLKGSLGAARADGAGAQR